jgi:hypothetical protein
MKSIRLRKEIKMIHDNSGKEVSYLDEQVNPFYLVITNNEFTNLPLPRAVKMGVSEALWWRDLWESSASEETKSYCLYHPTLRNWVGGAENSLAEVNECHQHYGLPLLNNPAYRPFPHQTGL